MALYHEVLEFVQETKLYRQEEISSADLEWTTNGPVIDMLSG